jgi:hypothetical protein
MNFFETKNYSQCPSGNLGNFAYDTIVSASSGNYSTQFNFQRVHGRSLLTCAGYCTATGEIATIHVKNNITLDGFNFPFIHPFLKNISTNNYKFIHVARRNRSKIHFCRVKQLYPNGHTWFNNVESIRPKNSGESKINIYRDRSKNVVGIKFVNIFSGKFLFQISNTQGQTVFSKELDVFDGGFSDNVTERNVLGEANRSNEPSVLCQSTFN